jgi:PTS system nitrogen regulatory IIA component
MKIQDFLAPASVIATIEAGDKPALLNELGRRGASLLGLSAAAVSDELTRRDNLGSTGIGHGVAIPHARLREVKRPFGMFARLKSPIEFQAIDEEPVDLVFLLLLPAASQLDQLNALAAVARKLRDADVLDKLRSAANRAELYRALCD